ncbi:MAG: hypothetical protein P8M30_03230 [Planctomycetaceae bacterium]|nr:hypothetical protein [Planctomycetaceae bacterium]
MNADYLREFMGWCLLINVGLIGFSTLSLVLMADTMIKIHQRLFGLDPDVLKQSYFNYLANFKLLVIVFNLVPYLALKMMGV